jgi:serine protease
VLHSHVEMQYHFITFCNLKPIPLNFLISAMRFFLLTLFFACFCNIGLQAQNATPYVPGQLLVQTKNDKSPKEVIGALRFFDGHETGFDLIKVVSKEMDIWLFSYDPALTTDDRMLFMARSFPDVIKEAQFNHYVQLRDTIVPDDPLIGSQWQWINDGSAGTYDADVDADMAWAITTGGTTANGDEIVVCVVDDGTDLNHPDLINNIWINTNEIDGDGLDNDSNGYIDDIYGWDAGNDNPDVDGGSHGVNVMGMIGAVGNNTQGGVGANWNVKIMMVKYGGTQESEVLAAYDYPLRMRKLYNETNGAQGAFVVATNSSWGIDQGQPSDAPLWCASYDTLGYYGVLSCGATSNSNLNIDVVGDLPTACPSEYMISVARTSITDNTAGGYGATMVDLGAPGIDIYTTSSGGGYTTTTGTSFASPLVAGMVGLLYSIPCSSLASLAQSDPAAAAILVRDAIFDGVDITTAMTGKALTNGRANLGNAATLLMEGCGGCQPPSAVSFTGTTQTTTGVIFTMSDSATSTMAQYRVQGTETWTDLGSVASPFNILDLALCTTYELQFMSLCLDSVSNWSGSYTFVTAGCCTAPVATIAVEGSDLTISWAPVETATSYLVAYTVNGIENSTVVASGTTLSFTADPCSTIEWQVSTYCNTGLFGQGNWASLITAGCGACTDLVYCIPEGGSTADEYIENITIDSWSNSSQGSIGYDNFTQSVEAITANTNGVYDISVTPGFTGQSYQESIRVWIDYNQDGLFDGTGELAFDPGTTNSVVSGTLAIPADATLGLTRMRVGLKYVGANGNPPGTCSTFQYGEYEDYCINIAQGGEPACAIITGLDTVEVGGYSIAMSWAPVDSATTYSLQYKKTSITAWSTVTGLSGTTYQIDGLEPCLSYDMRVRAICPNFDVPYSSTATFITDCTSSTSAVKLGDDWTIAPNPFTNTLSIKLGQPLDESADISIQNALGQSLISDQIAKGQSRISLTTNDLADGAYWVVIRFADGSQTAQPVVKD